MKPIAAIIEKAIDVDLLEQQIAVALTGERDAGTTAARHEQLGAAARETQRVRRLEVGRMLLKLRGAWPPSGPKAKGWSECLARLKLDDSTAVRYMNEARMGTVHGQPPGTQPKDSAHERPVSQTSDAEPAAADRDVKPANEPAPANVHGGSGEKPRGTYCTPKKYADAVGPWDLDPFSNPRSRIVSTLRCMLEDGGDGITDAAVPGSFRLADGSVVVATPTTRVWLQPPYGRGFVKRVVPHYRHTRFCALLRFAPDTDWFADLWPRVSVIAIPRERLPFETPDGVEIEGADDGEDAGAPFPHVFYYADERDVTDEIRRLCIVLRVDH